MSALLLAVLLASVDDGEAPPAPALHEEEPENVLPLSLAAVGALAGGSGALVLSAPLSLPGIALCVAAGYLNGRVNLTPFAAASIASAFLGPAVAALVVAGVAGATAAVIHAGFRRPAARNVTMGVVVSLGLALAASLTSGIVGGAGPFVAVTAWMIFAAVGMTYLAGSAAPGASWSPLIGVVLASAMLPTTAISLAIALLGAGVAVVVGASFGSDLWSVVF